MHNVLTKNILKNANLSPVRIMFFSELKTVGEILDVQFKKKILTIYILN